MTVSFDDIPAPAEAQGRLIGHDAAERELLTAWNGGRMPHAWLFAGPQGVGKETLAYRLARYVLAGAPQRDTLDVAADDAVSRRVASGGHADLKTVRVGFDDKRKRERSEIVVDDIRGLGDFLRLTPGEGGWRVAIVDSAERMNRNAANALLKVLEEPPARALLILVCHAPGRLPATVRSRCGTLRLGPLARDQAIQLFGSWRTGLDDASIATLADLADGSPGRALALARAGGLDLCQELLAVLDSLPALDIPAAHALADKLARPGQEAAFRAAGDLLLRWVHGTIRMAATGRPADGGMVASGPALAAARSGLEGWLAVWEKLNRLMTQVEGANMDRKQTVLSALFALDGAARA